MDNQHNKFLSYAGAVFLIILSVIALVVMVVYVRGQRGITENTITVTGTAERSGAPDLATFSFGVVETSDTPEQAQEVISKKTANILEGIKNLEVEEKDIVTNSYTINPRYEWVQLGTQDSRISPDGISYFPGTNNNQVLVGYDVRQSINVKVRNLDTTSKILSLLAKEGVEDLYGPNFEIEDPEKLQEEARIEAIADAKEKAKRLGQELGVTIGKIVSFNEGSDVAYPFPGYAMAEMSAAPRSAKMDYAPELPSGENTIHSQVTITYKIK